MPPGQQRTGCGSGSITLGRVPDRRRALPLRRAARLLARPALSPIDGRVADINRRVESVRTSTESSLDAYAQSAAESSSYIGVELRRLQDLLAGLAERLEFALSSGAPAPVQVNERIVEMPFAMAALGRLKQGARVLDIGGAESTFALSAASLGYRVTAVDRRPFGYAHPKLESHPSLLEDRESWPDPFAAAFLISASRHVGPGPYRWDSSGSPKDAASADLALVVDRVRELLSPDGLMILTVAYGTHEVTETERVHNEDSLDRLLAGWHIVERQIAVQCGALVWEVDKQVEPGARAVAMLVATPNRQR